jgi:hypothetical protein
MTAVWLQALEKLEIATARLESAIPDNVLLAEEALALRGEAIAEISALPRAGDVVDVLRALVERGEEAARHLRLARARLTVELGNVEQQRLLMRALDSAGSMSRVSYSG